MHYKTKTLTLRYTMTQIESARNGRITESMEKIAKREDISKEKVRRRVANGKIVILNNSRKENRITGIGKGLRVKVNANIGTSREESNIQKEIRKATIAEQAGADTLMDLSTGKNLKKTRKKIMETTNLPIGTVPIYQAGIRAAREKGSILEMTEDDMFNTIRAQAKEGVDFMTLHCGVTKKVVNTLRKRERIMDMVSRGGTFHAAWILHHERENPLYENFDYLLEIAQRYDITLSLGDGMRPGCIFDATDSIQIQELMKLGELAKKARDMGVQTMIEGPGHVPLDQIQANVQLEKELCDGAPFYVLGPLPTDIAPGYDHIVGAIGGALAGMAGADFLCYVTPSEHLGLPGPQAVKKGVIVTKIAAHIVDIAKNNADALQWDRKMAEARAELDWKTQIKSAINSKKAEELFNVKEKEKGRACSMCGEYCALKILAEELEGENSDEATS